MSDRQLNFVAVGPLKTGTSWIYDYLIDYERVALPTKVKETFFFDCKYDQGLDWYFSHFAESELEQKQVGEIAPSYFHSDTATQKIYAHNPQCKILITLREPVARLVSFYQHMQQRGEIKPDTSFIEAVSTQKVVLDSARYYHHLSRWLETFGRENVAVILFENLKQSPADFAQELCQKLNLELEDTERDLGKKVNASYSPVNHNLSKIAYSSVNLLHRVGLHKVVDYGKSLGVKKILFSGKPQKTEVTNADKQAAFDLIKADLIQLEKYTDLDLSTWKTVWQEFGCDLEITA